MKPGTFTQIYVHIVFSVKYRKYLIQESWEDQLYKYITGIVQGLQNKMLAINGMPDHIHLLVRMRPHVNISELVREIKKGSVNFMVDNKLIDKSFQWQNGYGAFSHNSSNVHRVIQYIRNQKEHHKKKGFKEEYREFMVENEIDFKEQFLFSQDL